MVVVALVVLVAAGCGSASSTSTKSASTKSASTNSTSTTTAKQAGSSPAPDTIPSGSVAVVVDTPITRTAFDHWMYVAAKSQVAGSPGQPVIVPDPPDFKSCIAQVHKQLPSLKKASVKTLTADCQQLYTTLSSQVMDFLIKADWIQADGARQGIAPSDAQVDRSFSKDKQQQFPNGKGYQAFLTKTGQSDQDVRFRIRVNIIFGQLAAREKGSATAKQTAVTKREKQLYGAKTRCAALVVMADCGNDRG